MVEAAKDGKSLATAEAKSTKTSGKVTGRSTTLGSPAAACPWSQISIKEPVLAVPSEQLKVG
jgi:hypothetical protein